MTDFKQFTEMLKRAGIKFKTKHQKGNKKIKIVKIFGRFNSDQTMFKFDESEKLYYVGSFDEPSIRWNENHGKFIRGKTVRRYQDMTKEQKQKYEQMYNIKS